MCNEFISELSPSEYTNDIMESMKNRMIVLHTSPSLPTAVFPFRPLNTMSTSPKCWSLADITSTYIFVNRMTDLPGQEYRKHNNSREIWGPLIHPPSFYGLRIADRLLLKKDTVSESYLMSFHRLPTDSNLN